MGSLRGGALVRIPLMTPFAEIVGKLPKPPLTVPIESDTRLLASCTIIGTALKTLDTNLISYRFTNELQCGTSKNISSVFI